jgi:hypothetical protein
MAKRASESGAAAKVMLAWVAILGLLAAVGWLLSDRNARTWSLVPEEGRLLVEKGLFLPTGRATFKTADPVLAKVYAPLVPPPGKALPVEATFSEQGEVDRALYATLAAWARDDVATGDPARLERGLGYLERAMELPGISAAQREDLAALRAESGFFEARRLLEKARAELSEAAEKLRLTAASRSTHALDAQAVLHELAPAIDATVAAVRSAGAPNNGPAPAEAVPGAPASPPEGPPQTQPADQ